MIWLLLLACGTASHVDYTPGALQALDAKALEAHLEGTSEGHRVYNFWATWCGPCKRELPELIDFAGKHPEVQVVLVNLDVGAVRDKKVVPFIENFGLDTVMNVQLDDPDPGGAVGKVVFGWPDRIPVTLVVRPDGTEKARFAEVIDRDDLEKALAP